MTNGPNRWLSLLTENIGVIGTALVTALGTLFISHARQERAAKKEAADRLLHLEGDMQLLKQTVQPISVAMQALFVKRLTHFHTPRNDWLLSRLGPPMLLTPDEEKELANSLAQIAEETANGISEDERAAAHLLPYLVQWVRRELESPTPEADLKVVMVSIPRAYE